MDRDHPKPDRWRLTLRLQGRVGSDPDVQKEFFSWLRVWLIPACFNAPFRITLSLENPREHEAERSEPEES